MDEMRIDSIHIENFQASGIDYTRIKVVCREMDRELEILDPGKLTNFSIPTLLFSLAYDIEKWLEREKLAAWKRQKEG